MAKRLYPGSDFRLRIGIKVAGQLADPARLIIRALAPDGTILVFDSDQGEVTRESKGVWYAELSPDQAGDWILRVETYAPNGADEIRVPVFPSQVVGDKI